jgi:hypothetical protein
MLKFLLDQGFPKPMLKVDALDRKVGYIHLRDFDTRLSRSSTPDWMVVLAAEAGGFAGIVTRDRSQLNEPETMIALERTRLSVVTWSKGIEDPVREWGMLLAYMPQVTKRIESEGPHIFTLPNPRLDPKHMQKRHDAAARVANMRNLRYRNMQSEAIGLMKRHLSVAMRDDLVGPLDKPVKVLPKSPVEAERKESDPRPTLLDE